MSSRIIRYLPLLLLLGSAFVPFRILEVQAQKSEKILLFKPFPTGLHLELSYIHSVEKVPVVGLFQIARDGRIEPKQTMFASFGAGLPFEGGKKAGVGWFVKEEGPTPVLEELVLSISPETKQELRINGLRLELHKLEHGEKVKIRVRKHLLAEVIWHYAIS
ncbi:MAG: DUF1850 domain-containing protein [bacterium]